jgi:hypothetical protein
LFDCPSVQTAFPPWIDGAVAKGSTAEAVATSTGKWVVFKICGEYLRANAHATDFYFNPETAAVRPG